MSSPVAELLGDLARVLDALGLRWYLFGAQAALLYGAARLTADVDVTVALGARPAARLAEALQQGGFALRVTDPEFVERTRVLPLYHRESGMALDVVLAGPGIEELFLERAMLREIDEVTVPVACAEDLIVMKILAGRTKDLEDVAAIVAAQGASLDLDVVRSTLRLVEQALDQRDLLPQLEVILRKRPR